jgi:lysozyme
MLFNMGGPRFQGFFKMRRAIEEEDFVEAAAQMMDSKWATQVGHRARELAMMMETGKWLT